VGVNSAPPAAAADPAAAEGGHVGGTSPAVVPPGAAAAAAAGGGLGCGERPQATSPSSMRGTVSQVSGSQAVTQVTQVSEGMSESQSRLQQLVDRANEGGWLWVFVGHCGALWAMLWGCAGS
jgi:hypothetical protein